MLFPVELERSAGRQRPQDTPTSRLLFRRLPSHTFPSAVLGAPLCSACRSPPLPDLHSTRVGLASTSKFQLTRLDSSARHPRRLGREPAIRILRTRSPEPPGPTEFRLPMPALLLLLLLAAAPAPARAGDPYAYYDWEVSYISAQPLGVKQKVPPVPPLSLPCIPATAASTLT